jgi:hypothetical protein
MSDSEEISHIPDDLFTRVKRSRFWVLENADLEDQKEVSDLVARLYDYPDDDFYLFKKHDVSTNCHLQAAVDAEVILLTEWQFNYFPHPQFKRDYVQLDKHRINWDWEREVIANSPMYVRFELKLSPKARRALEHQQLIAAQKHADSNPLELKPNFMGLGIDVYKALDWLRNAFRKSE